MKRFIENEDSVRYRSDCERIVDIAARHSVQLSISQAERLWDSHSDSFAAGWLILDHDDEVIWRHIEFEMEKQGKVVDYD